MVWHIVAAAAVRQPLKALQILKMFRSLHTYDCHVLQNKGFLRSQDEAKGENMHQSYKGSVRGGGGREANDSSKAVYAYLWPVCSSHANPPNPLELPHTLCVTDMLLSENMPASPSQNVKLPCMHAQPGLEQTLCIVKVQPAYCTFASDCRLPN